MKQAYLYGPSVTWNNNNWTYITHVVIQMKKTLGMDSILKEQKDQW